MKIDWGFLKFVAVCYVGVGLVIVLPLALYANPEIARSALSSGLASLFHLLLGYVFIEYGFDKSNTTFLKVILGGTLLRMFLLVALVLVLVRVFEFQTTSLILSLLFYYVLNLGIEINFLQKKVALKR